MALAEQLLAAGQGLLVQRDGLIHPAGRLVGVGEVVAGVQRVRVGLAEQPLPVGEDALVQRNASASRPACW